ncbi:L-fucose isomerase [Enterococcus hirae]|uniref:L-fucose isomerase n=1 Tax=Enterococcus hirae TaxID=1354 RepID=UPI000B53D094|nr:L-fucose isomerase [Enterococcus hirae]EMF0042947.1 L-fucose isomerase [Enterococcus hirae]EMF0054661.1 L-fucose isomerase [Enterococcus hirae]EMF0119565.1 L-fucose isomerase [Enterococcus hirae]EMF0624535.1 L-fucose isomerase [Enterococcus hirae]MBZ3645735.1 L-fucose isomerase [Enterococcus hirae]
MNYPKIGIRPTIDGRQGGVRESLEQQTLDMARRAKELIESSLYYMDGTPVQCVLPEQTIGGYADASFVDDDFARQDVVATLTVTPCWCYGTETIDLRPDTFKAIWGFNGTERPGAVYLAAAMSGYAQKGIPAYKIYGEQVQDSDDKSIPADVQEKILLFARASVAAGEMKNKSYVNIGASSMGIAGSQINQTFFEKYLGMQVEYVDMTEVLRRIELNIFDPKEYDTIRTWIKQYCQEGIDINAGKSFPEVITKSRYIAEEDQWDFIAKQTLIVRDLLFGNPELAKLGWLEEAKGRNAIAGGFQGQRQWTDWLPNGDFMESILTSTFDWNGPKQPVSFATENDTCNAAAMLFGSLLTNKAPIFSDVRTYWSAESVERITGHKLTGKAQHGLIHLLNSGASALDGSGGSIDHEGNPTMKEFWNMTKTDIQACLEKKKWCRANYEYFRGGGFSSQYHLQAELPLTLIRLNIVEGVGPTLQVAEGYSCALPDEVHDILNERTDQTWPTLWFAPNLGEKGFEDVYTMMNHWGSNHGASVHGHVGAELLTLASMLRIPVSLHNVPSEKIFRPHAFSGFGTKDLEAADFNACQSFGPFYK